MYDLDAGHHPTLALGTTATTDAEIADIERQMEALSLRHCELMEAKRIAFARSRPIPVSSTALTMSTDFWDHRHRVMAGSNPKIARTSSHVERMSAAASGEIKDAATSLRRERN